MQIKLTPSPPTPKFLSHSSTARSGVITGCCWCLLSTCTSISKHQSECSPSLGKCFGSTGCSFRQRLRQLQTLTAVADHTEAYQQEIIAESLELAELHCCLCCCCTPYLSPGHSTDKSGRGAHHLHTAVASAGQSTPGDVHLTVRSQDIFAGRVCLLRRAWTGAQMFQ